jgi:hypothetical protein
MIAKTIIDSDAFLDMPQSTQLLYFHLNMRADDDGFLNNAKSIMRNVGCKDDDLKILASKKFIIPFESGVIVIKHWKIHNYIAKDRYNETKYKNELAMLNLDENNAYSLQDKDLESPYTECIQNVDSLSTQVRLGKVRLDKEYKNLPIESACENQLATLTTEVKTISEMKDPIANLYQDLLTKYIPAETWGNIGKERKNLIELSKKSGRSAKVGNLDPKEFCRLVVSKYLSMKAYQKQDFWKNAPITPTGLLTRWDSVIDSLNQDQGSSQLADDIEF